MSNHAQIDCMQWLIDTSPVKKPWDAKRMVHEIMIVWFSTVHTISIVQRLQTLIDR